MLPAPLDRQVLAEVYGSLVRWTQFWLDSRRAPGHPLAHYQHGNDSGWDNSTTFDRARLIESPDLAAFLVVQLDVLAELARELGRQPDAADWLSERAAMLTALLGLWEDETFVARAVATGDPSKTTSLLNTLPIIASAHLPEEVNRLLADRISERFRRLCERSGFAENFDALTGEGLRDRAYTWTASCYLTLAREYEERLATDGAAAERPLPLSVPGAC